MSVSHQQAVSDQETIHPQQAASLAQETVSLTLDILHQPRLVPELEPHPDQTLDSAAKYHFFMPAGVTLDAARFLALLQTPDTLTGLSIFAKTMTETKCVGKNPGDACNSANIYRSCAYTGLAGEDACPCCQAIPNLAWGGSVQSC